MWGFYGRCLGILLWGKGSKEYKCQFCSIVKMLTEMKCLNHGDLGLSQIVRDPPAGQTQT